MGVGGRTGNPKPAFGAAGVYEAYTPKPIRASKTSNTIHMPRYEPEADGGAQEPGAVSAAMSRQIERRTRTTGGRFVPFPDCAEGQGPAKTSDMFTGAVWGTPTALVGSLVTRPSILYLARMTDCK